ncbi:MAG TPA: DUF444 family protein [Symbiobacteriaceae bacterium]
MSTSQHDWSLHRKGPQDQARHSEKIKEAIKENLPEIIAEESIITSDGKKLVKVPIRSLEEYRFRFDPYQGEKIGQGDGDSQVGDILGRGPGKEGDQGKKAGDGPGSDFFEAEVTVDDLAELIFADLGLPDLRPKATQEIPTEAIKFTEVRKKGPMSNLDKRRTIMENLKRNARQGLPEFANLNNDDLRFKVWEQDYRPTSSAVVVAMRDASGSMGEFKKYITRSLFFWMMPVTLHVLPASGPHTSASVEGCRWRRSRRSTRARWRPTFAGRPTTRATARRWRCSGRPAGISF